MAWIILAVLIVMTAGVIWQRRHECREWNNGICQYTGDKWEAVDMDSQGGVLFASGAPDNRHYTWQSGLVSRDVL